MIIGVETEYGIHSPGLDDSHTYLSCEVIGGATGRRFDPVDDELAGDLMLPSVMAHNGSRLYVDHAHPEYSGPECSTALDVTTWDAAGDALILTGARAASARTGLDIRCYKNNTDGKGHSYGCHENYLLPRGVPFERIVAQFTGFLVSRVVVTGSGRVGLGVWSEQPGFQISQRADYFERLVGLETTVNRPIINTRDEPHADPRHWRRLHVIPGDATLSQLQTFVKVGSAAAVLAVIAENRCHVPELDDPLGALRTFSRDTTCRVQVLCRDGVRRSAVELQRLYLDAAGGEAAEEWSAILTDLAADPLRCADRLDWAAKLRLMQGLRTRHGLGWGDPRLAAIDLAYADLDPQRSLHAKLVARGDMRSLVDPAVVARAMTEPPPATRAMRRAQLLREHGDAVLAADWSVLSVLQPGGRVRILHLPDPAGRDQAPDANPDRLGG